MTDPKVLRYTAFDVRGDGGNPAGVVLDGRDLTDEQAQAIAAEVGYSETAFLTKDDAATDGFAVNVANDSDPAGNAEPRRFRIRYFSPLAEVAFCGHATIATAVALAERDGIGDLALRTSAGEVRVRTDSRDGRIYATLTSVATSVREVDQADLDAALTALGWDRNELDPGLPSRIANAGVDHLVIAAASRARLADLDYDTEKLGELMALRGWTTLQLVWRENDQVFHARNPFPPGGVVEDPATGAAAAAFGAYLRDLGLVTPPANITIRQGEDMGRPSLLFVDIPTGATAGVRVSGTAAPVRE